MADLELGRLAKVEIRDVWKSEPNDFTPWLASDENISLLGETIGLDLEVEAQEKNVGPFRADILCKDTASQTWVLIENQLERTDHIHLGQLITYAAGLQAATIVWVAARFTDEHRAALDWMNDITSDDFSFFGLEVELWKIGDSQAAPKFNVVCEPNDWARSVSSAAKGADGSLTETEQTQLAYWTALRSLMEQTGGAINPTKAHPSGFMDFSLGKSGIWLSAWVRVRDKGIGVRLTIGNSESLAYYKLMEEEKEKYQAHFDTPLNWRERPGKPQKLVEVVMEEADPADREDWQRQHDWILDQLDRFHKAFSKAVRTLDPADYVPEEPT